MIAGLPSCGGVSSFGSMDNNTHSTNGEKCAGPGGSDQLATILFNSAMFRAVVEGRKSQTRRIIKPQEIHPDFGRPDMEKAWVDNSFGTPCLKVPHLGDEEVMQRIHCPYGYAGDLMVGRETGPELRGDGVALEITGVRIERLRDISDEDAVAEGVDLGCPEHEADQPLPTMLFERLWDSIYGEGAWERNPWVWVINFSRKEDK